MTRATAIPQTIILHVPFRVVKRCGRKEMVVPAGTRLIVMDKRSLSERDTCTKIITPDLRNVGWDEIFQIRDELNKVVQQGQATNLLIGQRRLALVFCLLLSMNYWIFVMKSKKFASITVISGSVYCENNRVTAKKSSDQFFYIGWNTSATLSTLACIAPQAFSKSDQMSKIVWLTSNGKTGCRFF